MRVDTLIPVGIITVGLFLLSMHAPTAQSDQSDYKLKFAYEENERIKKEKEIEELQHNLKKYQIMYPKKI